MDNSTDMGKPTKLDRLLALLREAPDEIFIQPHDVPDPDAIASCAGLRHLLSVKGVSATIVYDRDIEKVDALKLLEVFSIELVRAQEATSLGKEDWVILIDVQKGTGNRTDLAAEEVAVIDHHELLDNWTYRFTDVRPEVGACSSIIADYFFENSITPPRKLATALLFGILKDTDSLTRGVSDLDIDMFYRLYRHADMALIKELSGSQLTMEDLRLYADAFKTVEVYGTIGFMRLDCSDDSLLGAATDIVLSLDTVEVVVAYSVRPSGVKISARSETPAIKANALVRSLLDGIGIGGGHSHMAGGFIPAGNIPTEQIGVLIRSRTIAFVEALATAGATVRNRG